MHECPYRAGAPYCTHCSGHHHLCELDMPDNNECPFEHDQWLTDGKKFGRVVANDRGRRFYRLSLPPQGEAYEAWSIHQILDWTKWVPVDPADIFKTAKGTP